MITIKEVVKNISGLEEIRIEDFNNEVICAFEDFEHEGINEVIVSKDEGGNDVNYQAYINHKDSPIICIKVDEDEDTITVIEAWKA